MRQHNQLLSHCKTVLAARKHSVEAADTAAAEYVSLPMGLFELLSA